MNLLEVDGACVCLSAIMQGSQIAVGHYRGSDSLHIEWRKGRNICMKHGLPVLNSADR